MNGDLAIMFGSVDNMMLLSSCRENYREIMIDATFSSCPKPVLPVVHGMFGDGWRNGACRLCVA